MFTLSETLKFIELSSDLIFLFLKKELWMESRCGKRCIEQHESLKLRIDCLVFLSYKILKGERLPSHTFTG